MLKADRAHLESRMRQLAIVIREKEFGYECVLAEFRAGYLLP
jgi:hypothetical protein